MARNRVNHEEKKARTEDTVGTEWLNTYRNICRRYYLKGEGLCGVRAGTGVQNQAFEKAIGISLLARP
jgi:hypothetical protein